MHHRVGLDCDYVNKLGLLLVEKEMLFTIVLDYIDDSYPYQVESRKPEEAFLKWLETGIDPRQLGLEKIEYDLYEIEDFNAGKLLPTDTAGLKNVWCGFVTLNGELGIVHIIATREE